MLQVVHRYISNREGNVVTVFGLALPAIMIAVAGTIDYSGWLSTRAQMQSAADMAALAGAKEMRLANSSPTVIASTARNRALAALGEKGVGAMVSVDVTNNNTNVQVQIDLTAPSMFGGLSPAKLSHIHVQATALTAATTPTCLLALDPLADTGLELDTAAISSNGCATYSNAKSSKGLSVTKGTIAAAQTCSAGGYKGSANSVTPAALTDCPVISDPLASRAPPSFGGCDFTNKIVASGSETLYPGTYCGGLSVTQGATAFVGKGVYVIKDGPLAVDGSATLKGDEAGFYLTGATSILAFDFESSISLTAPKDGPMAGILMFEDPTSLAGRDHVFASRNAPQLLGTLYFPRGNLTIGAKVPKDVLKQEAAAAKACSKVGLTYPCTPAQANIATVSAWTIVIANQITINFVVNLVLNTNYSSTNIPPPIEFPVNVATLTK